MEKIQALITLHKDKLEELGLTPLVVDPQSRELAQGILLDGYTDGERNGLTLPLSQLLFSTPFLSWLERKEINRSDGNNIQLHELCLVHESDYHKINLVLLDTDEARIQYLESNLL